MASFWSTNFLTLQPPVRVPYDLSGQFFLTQDSIRTLREAWNTFQNITISNINTSTLIGQNIIRTSPSSGDISDFYYVFPTLSERNRFLQGQLLHSERYPYINFSSLSVRPNDIGANAFSGPDTGKPIEINNTVRNSELIQQGRELTTYVNFSTLQDSNRNKNRPYFRSYQDYIAFQKAALRLNSG